MNASLLEEAARTHSTDNLLDDSLVEEFILDAVLDKWGLSADDLPGLDTIFARRFGILNDPMPADPDTEILAALGITVPDSLDEVTLTETKTEAGSAAVGIDTNMSFLVTLDDHPGLDSLTEDEDAPLVGYAVVAVADEQRAAINDLFGLRREHWKHHWAWREVADLAAGRVAPWHYLANANPMGAAVLDGAIRRVRDSQVGAATAPSNAALKVKISAISSVLTWIANPDFVTTPDFDRLDLPEPIDIDALCHMRSTLRATETLLASANLVDDQREAAVAERDEALDMRENVTTMLTDTARACSDQISANDHARRNRLMKWVRLWAVGFPEDIQPVPDPSEAFFEQGLSFSTLGRLRWGR